MNTADKSPKTLLLTVNNTQTVETSNLKNKQTILTLIFLKQKAHHNRF